MPKDTEEILKEIEAAGARGDSGGVTALLVKGLLDAYSDLRTLMLARPMPPGLPGAGGAPGAAAPPPAGDSAPAPGAGAPAPGKPGKGKGKGKHAEPDGDENGEGESDGDEDNAADAGDAGGGDDDDADEGGAAGYQDMALGRMTAGGDLDVTEWVIKSAKAMAELPNLVKALQKQSEQIDGLQKQVDALTAGVVGSGAELAKAVGTLNERVLDIPGPAVSQLGRMPAAPRTNVADAAFIGGNQRAEKQAMAKALAENVISDAEAQRFHLTRTFDADPKKSAETRGRIEKLAGA